MAPRRLCTALQLCTCVALLLLLLISPASSQSSSEVTTITTSPSATTLSATTASNPLRPTTTTSASPDSSNPSDPVKCPGEDAGPELHPGPPDCELPGNSDFYGLGVRLGIYLSWLTSWIANNFLPTEMSGTFDTNSIFLSAIGLTVLSYSSIYDINIVDALVLLQLSFGFVFSVMSLWGYRTMYYRKEGPGGVRHFGGWGTHCRLGLCVAISAYSVWFWTRGLAGGLPHACNMREECGGLKTFLFGELSVFGDVRTFYAVAGVVLCVYYGAMVVAAAAAALHHLHRWVQGKETVWEPQQLDESDGLDVRELTVGYVVLSAFNLAWGVFSAVTVELTLNFNHVVGVLGGVGLMGPGQLLPLFIGSFGFVRICWLLLKEYYIEPRQERARNDESHGEAKHGLRALSGLTTKTTTPTPNLHASDPHAADDDGPVPPPSRNLSRRITSMKMVRTTSNTRHISRHKKAFLHRLITAWLPWLTCFEWWRRRGSVGGRGGRGGGGPGFELLASSADGRMPGTTDALRSTMVGAATASASTSAGRGVGGGGGSAGAEGDDRRPMMRGHRSEEEEEEMEEEMEEERRGGVAGSGSGSGWRRPAGSVDGRGGGRGHDEEWEEGDDEMEDDTAYHGAMHASTF